MSEGNGANRAAMIVKDWWLTGAVAVLAAALSYFGTLYLGDQRTALRELRDSMTRHCEEQRTADLAAAERIATLEAQVRFLLVVHEREGGRGMLGSAGRPRSSATPPANGRALADAQPAAPRPPTP